MKKLLLLCSITPLILAACPTLSISMDDQGHFTGGISGSYELPLKNYSKDK